MIHLISEKVIGEELKDNFYDAESKRNELESWWFWGYR
jgi:hypothetical protein